MAGHQSESQKERHESQGNDQQGEQLALMVAAIGSPLILGKRTVPRPANGEVQIKVSVVGCEFTSPDPPRLIGRLARSSLTTDDEPSFFSTLL